MGLGVITIGIDPEPELGPLTLTWHGMFIAVGILVGALFAGRYSRERGLDRDRLVTAVIVISVAGIVGARVFFLLENDPAALLNPGDWLGTRGFAFYGAIILGTLATAVYLTRAGLGSRYLDALAAGFPAGMAVGRIGDVINGEHYGPASDLPWAFRYTHPDALVPSSSVAYHSGGFYEVVLALAMFAVIWPLRGRFRTPLGLLWAVIAFYGAGRFLMFFYRSDSDDLALGLNGAQWTSLALVAVAGLGVAWSRWQSSARLQALLPEMATRRRRPN